MTKMVVDPETGLPALPEDMFWRVEETSLGEGKTSLWLHIMKKHPPTRLQRWFNRPGNVTRLARSPIIAVVENHGASSKVYDIKPSDVSRTASKMLSEMLLGVANTEKAKRVVEELVGDYPPKTLKES